MRSVRLYRMLAGFLAAVMLLLALGHSPFVLASDLSDAPCATTERAVNDPTPVESSHHGKAPGILCDDYCASASLALLSSSKGGAKLVQYRTAPVLEIQFMLGARTPPETPPPIV